MKSKFVTISKNGKKNTYYFGSNGKAYKGWHKIKGKKYYFYRGTGAKAGIRAQSVRLTSSGGVVSVFNKYGVCNSTRLVNYLLKADYGYLHLFGNQTVGSSKFIAIL